MEIVLVWGIFSTHLDKHKHTHILMDGIGVRYLAQGNVYMEELKIELNQTIS